MLTPMQARVAQVLSEAVADLGFAIGGGAALQLHGVVDRDSTDIDVYAPSYDPQVYTAAEDAAVGALASIGYKVEVRRRLDWFRELIVTDPRSGEKVGVDLGVMPRTQPPIIIPPAGPVLTIADLRQGKLDALLDRRAGRDFTDVDAMLRSGDWSVRDLVESVRSRHPELVLGALSETFRAVRSVNRLEFAALGVDGPGIEELACRFDLYATEIDGLTNSDLDATPALTPPTVRPSST
ncbi:MAG: nucleotidyl transferase AbiEii/AbiGii toxin family protein [Propionibacteriaceae bacterium]|jgi:hypothetical protein|nr:nucleotidyl transferase AbiEii/AbiGii toxin family protein [Propionibacteriaceae bacterium]